MSVEATSATNDAGLTAAEQAYFDSRGANTEGLGAPDAGAQPAGGDVAKPDAAKTEAKPEGDAAKAAADSAKPDAAAKPGADLDPDEEPLGEDGKPQNPGRFIRFGAYDKERHRRKELEAALATERDARTKEQVERAKVAERLELLNAALTPQPKPDAPAAAAEPPDPEKDIFGYAKWQGEQLAALQKRLDEVTGKVGKVEEGTSKQFAEANLKSAYVADAGRFATVTPDFPAAYQHLLQTRDRQLAHLGETDPQKRAAIIAAEERGIVEGALKAGASPAERVYGLAKLMGYAAPAPDTKANGGAAPAAGDGKAAAANGAASNGAAANGSAAPAATSSVADEIARIKAGVEAGKSLGQAGGGPSGFTMEALATMSQEDFDAALAKMSKAKQRELFGG